MRRGKSCSAAKSRNANFILTLYEIKMNFRQIGCCIAVGLLSASLYSCGAGLESKSFQPDQAIFSREIQKSLETVVHSIVGVGAIFNYRVEAYNHQLVEGRFQPDSTSPTGYQLQAGNAIMRSQQTERVNGAGLIIHRDERHTIVLTCAHVVIHRDTINSYYRDSEGRRTDILHSRALMRKQEHYILSQSNHLIAAEMIIADERADLALLRVPSTFNVGFAYASSIAFDEPVAWGDFCYLFGYPKETKQLTSGLISLLPHEGFFLIDAVARSGFSGGPVFVARPKHGLQLAGIVRGVSSDKLNYLAPPQNALIGENLNSADLPQISAQEVNLINYGAAYAVGAKVIGKFLQDSAEALARLQITLAPHYLP